MYIGPLRSWEREKAGLGLLDMGIGRIIWIEYSGQSAPEWMERGLPWSGSLRISRSR